MVAGVVPVMYSMGWAARFHNCLAAVSPHRLRACVQASGSTDNVNAALCGQQVRSIGFVHVHTSAFDLALRVMPLVTYVVDREAHPHSTVGYGGDWVK